MSEDHVLKTIELFQQEISDAEEKLAEKKRLVNLLCPRAGIEPVYPDVDAAGTTAGIRADEFYGRPLATAAREVLQKRWAARKGAASVNEIYQALKAGGFHFKAKNDDYAKRGLYQSLNKNTAMFHRLPTGHFGLRDWYDWIRDEKPRPSAAEIDSSQAEVVDDDDDDFATEPEVNSAQEKATSKPR